MHRIPRSKFLKTIIAGAFGFPLVSFGTAERDRLRGDKVGWARLKTSSEHWLRHSNSDPELMRFFQDHTTLNIDPTWYAADVQDLGEMCKYPLLFSQSVQMVKDAKGRANLSEYLRRGGFLLIDACCNRVINPDFDVFFQEHVALLAAILPEARVAPLPSNHTVYHCQFPIAAGHPPHTYYGGAYDSHKAKFGLYGVTAGPRMVGLISLSGLQCGWDHMPAAAGNNVLCMQMLVNIYVYAMTQGG